MSQSPSFSPFASAGNVASPKSAERQTSILRYFELQSSRPKRQRRNLEYARNAKRSPMSNARGEQEKDLSQLITANNDKSDSSESSARLEVESIPVSTANIISCSSQQSDADIDVMIPPSPHPASSNNLTSTGTMKRSSDQHVSVFANVSFNVACKSEAPVRHNSTLSPQTVKSFSACKFYQSSTSECQPKVQEVKMFANVGYSSAGQPEVAVLCNPMVHSSHAIRQSETSVMMDDTSPQTVSSNKNITLCMFHSGSTSECQPKMKEFEGRGTAQLKFAHLFSESDEDEDLQNNDLSPPDIPRPFEPDAKISTKPPAEVENFFHFSEHNKSYTESHSIRSNQRVIKRHFMEKVVSVLLLCINSVFRKLLLFIFLCWLNTLYRQWIKTCFYVSLYVRKWPWC